MPPLICALLIRCLLDLVIILDPSMGAPILWAAGPSSKGLALNYQDYAMNYHDDQPKTAAPKSADDQKQASPGAAAAASTKSEMAATKALEF